MDKSTKRYISPLFVLAVQLVLYFVLGSYGWMNPIELFNLLLLSSNTVIAVLLFRGKSNLPMGLSIMLIIFSHAVIGQKMAPDSLTSGSILMVNILVLYVGFNIYEQLDKLYFFIFVTSYFVLFGIFIKGMDNAEALFMLVLMGLAATARNLRLLSYFWAMVLSFTLCQPYPWQAFIISFFVLKMIFTAKDNYASFTTLVFLACGLILVFFVLFPVLILLLEEDTRNIINILKDDTIVSAIMMTAITASISTIILAIFCIPFTYALSRCHFFGKALLLSLIDIPIIIPQSAAGIVLLGVFGKNQVLGELLFNHFGIRFDGTMLGIIVAQIFVAMPFMVKSALIAFEAVPLNLEHSARTLGASPLSSFLRVALPLSARSIFIGSIITWARAAGEFGAVLFVAPYPETAPISIYNRFTSVGVVQAAPLVAVLVLFSILIFFIFQLVSRGFPKSIKQEYEL